MEILHRMCATLMASLLSIAVVGQQLNLPKGMTEQEKLVMEEYLQSFNDRGISTPPPYSNIRTMAEWEEVQALVITWTGSFNTIQSQIVDAAQEECLVIIHCANANNVKAILSGNGVPNFNIDYIEIGYNSIWIRDYGSNTCYNNYVEDIFLVDWIYNRPRPLDDVLPDAYAAHLGIDNYSMTSPGQNIMSTGGNWMSNSEGTGFSSNLILDENDGNGPYAISYPSHNESKIDQLLNNWMGINEYIKMTVLPYDDIHHIDMHMKIIDDETLLVGEYPTGQSDGPQMEANLLYVLNNFTTKYGTPYKVYRIPQPSSTSGSFPPVSYYRTYANQTFVNNTVLLPTYRAQYDTTALAMLDTILPGYNIVGIDVDNSGQNLISQGGAIHCITHTVGVNDPIYIDHQKLTNTTDDINPYQANAFIKYTAGIAAASIWYTTSVGGVYSEVPMINTSGDNWSGLIPAHASGNTIYYYIEATAIGGKQITHPMTAPGGYHKFKVYGSGTVGEGSGSEIGVYTPIEMLDIYPNPASAITVIPLYAHRNTRCRIVLTNLLGEVVEIVYEGVVKQGKKNFFIDASEYAAGMYQVMIQTGEQKVFKKLVIK